MNSNVNCEYHCDVVYDNDNEHHSKQAKHGENDKELESERESAANERY